MRWIVRIGGQPSEAPTTTAVSPVVTSVEVLGNGGLLHTPGGQLIVVRGAEFGAIDDAAYVGTGHNQVDAVVYGAWDEVSSAWSRVYVASNCSILESFAVIVCRAAAGVGTSLRFKITISGVASVVSPLQVVISYAPPSITAVAPASVATSGGRVTLTVADMGGPGDAKLILFDGRRVENPSTLSDAMIQFDAPPGQGVNHIVTITVMGQVSAPASVGYAGPSMSSLMWLSGSAASIISLRILGANFGACCYLRLCACTGGVPAVFVSNNATVERCEVVALMDTSIDCQTRMMLGDIWVESAGTRSNSLEYIYGVLRTHPSISTVSARNIANPALRGTLLLWVSCWGR